MKTACGGWSISMSKTASDAIVSVGTTGESATLDEAEHCHVMRRTVEMAAGRIPVIAGTGANSTREAIDLTRCAMEAGVDACLLVTPYYNKPTQEGLYLHFRGGGGSRPGAADSVQCPRPARPATCCRKRLNACPRIYNIVGIKEATGNMDRAREIMERCGERL